MFYRFLAETYELCNIFFFPAHPFSTLSLPSLKDESLIVSDPVITHRVVQLNKCLALQIYW